MHIAEGFLPAAHCAVWYAAATPFVVHGARRTVKIVRENPENKLLLAAAGAFTFVLSAIKLPSVTGSSSHPTGTGAGAVLFRPPVMAFLGTIVLLFQALLLAHGGLTTLGANVFSMGIVGPWVGWATWAALKKIKAPHVVGIFAAFALADLATYCMTSIQLALAYPEAEGGMIAAAAKFLSIFAITQLPLAVIEGIVGILVFQLLGKVAGSDLTRLGLQSDTDSSSRRFGAIPAIGALLLALATVGIFIASMVFAPRGDAPEGEAFGGTDSAVTEKLEEAGTEPWFKPIFEPGSGEVESGLFAMQAALGAGLFGWSVGRLGRRKAAEAPVELPVQKA